MASDSALYASKETFLLTAQTVRLRVDSRSAPTGQPELVALTLADDLLFLLPRMHLDLSETLGTLADDYLPQSEDLVEELSEDVERLLRYRLLTSIHLLLCDLTPDPATGGSLVRYACEYTTALARPGSPESTTGALRAALAREQQPLDELRLVLVVAWDPKADWQKRAQLRRPHYNFDWSSPLDPYQQATVVRFSEGNT